ncbi:Stk1 family PASTA domain-containing Ser/Thr kinase [Gorillibacterium timonense]|uniref:Stk1 family PASTA domain-containing Ser/Thr kinase n=1 Tax=Gorillibacterium timonense TaxID=1689269 RepID=UPI00071DAA68|nr:Stk1 family PASTA domain-containing Ser/Thr kinase [Gorillibacterium timonense]
MIGQTLAGRYEILDRVGGGGMALVYKARDILLNRIVAVKVLRPQFVHDEEFIQRFRREAQSAAALSHPNIVSIYDVGQREDIHYIVMEYVEGYTLNDLIKEKAPLQVEEAVNIASQICDALDHAHSNQIIHRDIKPHNILIGRNGRVKVTDFGIARAGASSSITQTGSVVGSVHYFSPEHAKGTAAGAKSDIYSLGIVLYQMLTAKLPFSGESPVSVALKHLQENVEEPRRVNPLIPQSVENIILKAMRKNPDNRYRSAKEMLTDLESCLRPERRNEPKRVFQEIDEEDEERTRVIPAIRPDSSYSAPRKEEYRPSSQAPAPKKKIWVKPAIWAGIFIIVVVGLLIAAQQVKKMAAPEDITIPDVTGKSYNEAVQILDEAKLKAERNDKSDPKVEKDIVISQNPTGGPGSMKVKPDYVVQLYVSTGPDSVAIDNFVGLKLEDAVSALAALGMDPARITEEPEFSDKEEGTIVEQSVKAGDPFNPLKDSITFKTSQGREVATMPNLVGKKLSVAKDMLAARGLKVSDNNIVKRANFDQPEGIVFEQHPYNEGDEVDAGATNITLYVSTGQPSDAADWSIDLPIAPAKAGQASTVRIEVSDARSDNRIVDTKQIKEETVLNVPFTVTKDVPAKIKVFRDNALFLQQTFTYQNYLDSKSVPTTTPTPTATETPSAGNSEPSSPTPSNGEATPVSGSANPEATEKGN